MSGKMQGIVIAALIVLATIWLYNRFSGKSISDLGKKVA